MGVRIKRGAWFEAPKLSPDKFFLTVRKNLLRDNFGASNHTKIKSCRTPLGEITALPHTLYLLALEREGGKEKRERTVNGWTLTMLGTNWRQWEPKRIPLLSLVFITRRHARAVYAVTCCGLVLSVCPSQLPTSLAGVLSKRLHTGSSK